MVFWFESGFSFVTWSDGWSRDAAGEIRELRARGGRPLRLRASVKLSSIIDIDVRIRIAEGVGEGSAREGGNHWIRIQI